MPVKKSLRGSPASAATRTARWALCGGCLVVLVGTTSLNCGGTDGTEGNDPCGGGMCGTGGMPADGAAGSSALVGAGGTRDGGAGAAGTVGTAGMAGTMGSAGMAGTGGAGMTPESGADAPEAGGAVCGNHVVEQGEQCDDGNTRDGDGCSSICTDSHACEQCEMDNCPIDNALDGTSGRPVGQPECSAYTKTATAGNAAGKLESELCYATTACLVRTQCAVLKGAAFCYCGDVTSSVCQAGGAKGPCKAAIEDGLETNEPGAILNSITNVAYPAGGALNLAQCLKFNCGNPGNGDFGHGECVYNAASPQEAGADAHQDVAADISISLDAGSDAAAETSAPDAGQDAKVDVSSFDAAPDAAANAPPAEAGHEAGAENFCPANTQPSTAVCSACEELTCPHNAAGCATTGCTAQPACSDYPAPTDQALCSATLTCIRKSNCISAGVINCYCGTATLSNCQNGLGNGACKAEIEAGLKTTVPGAIVPALTNVSLPAGGALSLGQCDQFNCGPLNGTDECIPYCK